MTYCRTNGDAKREMFESHSCCIKSAIKTQRKIQVGGHLGCIAISFSKYKPQI